MKKKPVKKKSTKKSTRPKGRKKVLAKKPGVKKRQASKRVQYEELLESAYTNYREIFNKSSDAIYVHEMETGRLLDVNERASEVTGFTREELLTADMQEFITGHPDYTLDKAIAYIQKAAVGEPQFFEWLGKKKDGSHNWFEVNLKRATIVGKERILAFFREINARKKAEIELEEKIKYIESRTTEIADALLRFTLRDMSEEIFISERGDELDAIAVGINTLKDELEGRIIEVENNIRHLKESEEKFQKAFNNSSAGMSITRLSDSKYVDVNDAMVSMTGYSREELLNHNSVELGIVVNMEKREEVLEKLRKSGSAKNYEMSMRNRSGEIVNALASSETITLNGEKYTIGIIYDITERKKAEQELESVNRELEAFSYSVSHDLRAPLRAINGYAQMMIEDTDIDSEGRRLLQNIKHYANQMGMLIDDLLAFSKLGRTELKKRKINMNELTEGVIVDLEKSVAHSAKIKINKLSPMYADYGLLHQVMFNLISNAIKYSSKKDNPEVEISSEENENETIVKVKDNGAGFDMRYANKLFGVFQRLHLQEEFEGTGVGLAIVQRIISKHNGKIWAHAEPEKGAEFYFSIPKPKH